MIQQQTIVLFIGLQISEKIQCRIKLRKRLLNVSKCQSRIYVTFLRDFETSLGFFKINYKKCNYVLDPHPYIFDLWVSNLGPVLYG